MLIDKFYISKKFYKFSSKSRHFSLRCISLFFKLKFSTSNACVFILATQIHTWHQWKDHIQKNTSITSIKCQEFESGQVINFHKSEVSFSRNTPNACLWHKIHPIYYQVESFTEFMSVMVKLNLFKSLPDYKSSCPFLSQNIYRLRQRS